MMIGNMFENNIKEIKELMNINKNHDVKLIDSSFYDFELDHLIESMIIYKYHESLNDDDFNIIKNILFSYDTQNDYFYENLGDHNNTKFLSDIKENMVLSYIESKTWFLKEYNKLSKQLLNDADNDIESLSWFIVFNINNHELNITDADNINRYGEPTELISFPI